MDSSAKIYPGASVTPQQLYELAEEYRKASDALDKLGRPGGPLSRAPFRLVAIHAIELYLNSVLLQLGHAPDEIRNLQHDVGKRADLAEKAGLRLRQRTVDHLRAVSRNREYLGTRYDPESVPASQINRLKATVDELAKKVAPLLSAAAMARGS